VLAQPSERQGKYGRVSTPTKVIAGHLRTASAGAQLSPPVHRQLHRKAKHAAQRRSRRAARNELLTGQLTLLSGLLLEQLQQMSMLVLSRLYTQQFGQGRPQGLPGNQMAALISQCTQGTGLSGWELLACLSVSSPLLLCIASLCGKVTSMCPSLRHSPLPPASGPQHLNRQTSPHPALSPLATSCSPSAVIYLPPIAPEYQPIGELISISPVLCRDVVMVT